MKPWERTYVKPQGAFLQPNQQTRPVINDIGAVDMGLEEVSKQIGVEPPKPWEREFAQNKTYQEPVGPSMDEYSRSFGPEKPREFQGFFERVGGDMAKRAEIGRVIDQARLSGEQGLIESGLQKAGKVGAGLVNDVVGEAVVSGYRALPENIRNTVEDAGTAGLNYIGNTPPGRFAVDVAKQAVQGYGDFAENNPRAARNIESATNLGLLLAGAKNPASQRATDTAMAVGQKGAQVAVQGAGYVDDAAKAITKFADQNLVKHAPDITPDNIRKIGGDLFKKATQEGGVIAPEVADSYRAKVLNTLNLDGEAKLYASNPVAERLANNISQFAGKPLDFETAKAIDESLGDLAYATMDNFGKIDSTGKKFLDLQHDLRAAMNTLPNSGTIKEARKYWSTSLKMQDMQRIIDRAASREQPVTALKNGFSSLLNSKKIMQYSPAEVKAIKKAAETGIVTDAFKVFGSGLVPIAATAAGSVGGVPGAVLSGATGYAVQQGSKAVGVARQTGRANKALDAVAKEAGLPTKKLTMKQIMALPPDQAKLYLK